MLFSHQLWQAGILCFLLCVVPAFGGLMMDDLGSFEIRDQALWPLVSTGRDRYAGGALPLRKKSGGASRMFAFGSLRLQVERVGQLIVLPPIWESPFLGGLPGLNKVLLAWNIRIVPAQPVVLQEMLSESQLLVPEQIRINLATQTLAPEQ